MDAYRIEVKRILSHHMPTINVRLKTGLRLRRLALQGLKVLGGLFRFVRKLFPKRVYLTLE